MPRTPALRQERIAIIALVAVTMAWGGTFVVVKDGISQMPLMPLMTWRFAIAFGLLVLLRPRALRVDRRTHVQGAVLGAISFLGYLFQTVGLQYTSASVSGFITGMFVVITPLLGWLLFRERIAGAVWIAVVLACTGLAAISLNGWVFGRGEAWTLAGAAMWALQIIAFARFSTPGNAYSLGTLMIGWVAVGFALGAPLQGGYVMPPNAGVWWGILIAAVFATAFAFPVQSWGQAHLDATRAAVIFTMEPVFAGIFGFWIGGDRFTARVLIGALLILAAMFVAEFGPAARSGASAST